MPDQNQITIRAQVVTERPFGTRKQASLGAAFSTSPLYTKSGPFADLNKLREFFQTLVLDGNVDSAGSQQGLAGPGHGINSFDRDYVGTAVTPVPDFANVRTGPAGDPSTAFIPDLSSPGEGNSVNAAAKPGYDATNLVNSQPGVEFGSGLGGLVSPAETSSAMARGGTLGTYISGKSFQGSDGQP